MSLAAILLAAILSGCQNAAGPRLPEPSAEAKLRDVADLCRVYQKVHKAPPKSVADLSRGGNQATPAAYAALQSGEIILRLGAILPSTEKDPDDAGSDQVLAYAKQVPVEGGPVLMLNRRIRTMTAAEFKTAKLAGKSAE